MKVQQKMKQVSIFFAVLFATHAFAVNLTDFEVSSLSGDRTQILLTFDGAAPDPVGYSIESPARISLDFADTQSKLAEKYIQISSGNTRNAAILDTGGRTRVVFSLTKLVSYASTVNGNVVSIFIGEGVAALAEQKTNALVSSPETNVSTPMSSQRTATVANEIKNVDFRRTETGAGQVVVEFASSAANASVFEQGGNIMIRVEDFEVPPELRRRLDVVDFATAVHFINVYNEDNGVLIRLEVDGDYDYLAYQSDNSMTVEVNQLTEAESEARLKEKFPYNGDKLSLNFQDIEVRDVLQIIANYVGINLVASDSISGSITLRLNNVPWDQALDLVLKTNGLDKRQNGNVLLVAPAAELAEQERLELTARDQAERLAPLRTEYVQINYAKATDLAAIIQSNVTTSSVTESSTGEDPVTTTTSANGFLSKRGSVAVDERTNTLIITDTGVNLEDIRQAIAIFDVPVRQVLIEARIVTARTSVGEGMGIRWGGALTQNALGSTFVASGSLEQNVTSINSAGATTSFPDALAVNLPLEQNTGSLAVGFLRGLFNLDLEITALESLGQAEVISQPKVITSDGQQATIFSGQNVAILGKLIEAGLKLEVTPQITPDNRVVLNLTVNQDSISPPEASEGLVAIDTNSVTTQVLVENGATLVLGGVYRVEKSTSTQKTPILGDLPFIGYLFKRTISSDEKSELLIFITPRLVEEGLVSN
ncbi:type IV pilus secretin PilQ [Reinekea forsetii]|uniref:type IV pilus secretin PilQ n=2 Tax=Reinekea TaxID=230494 RepID=UPI0023524DAA|nr:type IV pilus secretin PilQ [Reinekea forsetii]